MTSVKVRAIEEGLSSLAAAMPQQHHPNALAMPLPNKSIAVALHKHWPDIGNAFPSGFGYSSVF